MSGLAGKRVVVTRPRQQASDLVDRLLAAGAIPVLFPTIEVAAMEDLTRLDRALEKLPSYDWVVFTSVNGVRVFWDRWSRQRAATGQADAFPPGVRIATIGPSTAAAIRARGGRVDFVPEKYVAEALVEGLRGRQGRRVLLPRAEAAREVLVEGLQALGASVDEIPLYRTLPAMPDRGGLVELARGVDAITFTSSSTVRNFVTLVSGLEESQHPGRYLLGSAAIACLGPITASTATAFGLPVDLIAEDYTIKGLVSALEKYCSLPHPDLEKKRWLPIHPL